MEIAFESPTHERLVNDVAALRKRYNRTKGGDSATAILMALDVLKAAESLADVPPSYRPHPLKGNMKGYFAIDVDKVHRVVFRPNHQRDPGFRIDAHHKIASVVITAIYEDYHPS